MSEFETPQQPEEPVSTSELEHTIVDPEVFGMKHVVEIDGQQVATDQTVAELKETANDTERGRAGNKVDDETGERTPVIIAGKGVLVTTRQPATIYMDMKGELGIMLVLPPIETAHPEIETPATDEVEGTKRKRGHGLLNTIRGFLVQNKQTATTVNPVAPQPNQYLKNVTVVHAQDPSKPQETFQINTYDTEHDQDK